MRKRPELVALILFAVLVAYAAGLDVFIIPVVQNMMATVDASFAWPSRIAIAISQYGFAAFMALLLLVAYTLKRTVPGDDRAQQARVLNLASLVVTVFIVLQGWMFVDFAVSAGKIVNRTPRPTASAMLRTPAAARASTP